VFLQQHVTGSLLLLRQDVMTIYSLSLNSRVRTGCAGTGNGDGAVTDGKPHVNGEAWIPAATQLISPRATTRHPWHSQDAEYGHALENGAPPWHAMSCWFTNCARLDCRAPFSVPEAYRLLLGVVVQCKC
jgi:hypothetical protein